ncbi:MAG: hypothetical protein ACTS85_03590 [Arsenophonus sp. NC-PG7-MAG3]
MNRLLQQREPMKLMREACGSKNNLLSIGIEADLVCSENWNRLREFCDPIDPAGKERLI